jgi:hypothetical protein
MNLSVGRKPQRTKKVKQSNECFYEISPSINKEHLAWGEVLGFFWRKPISCELAASEKPKQTELLPGTHSLMYSGGWFLARWLFGKRWANRPAFWENIHIWGVPGD